MTALNLTLHDLSLPIPQTTPTQVFTSAQLAALTSVYAGISYMRLSNILSSNTSPTGGTIWLSRSGPAQVGQPGSHPLLGGSSEIFQVPGVIPTNTLSAIADQVGLFLTVEVG